MTEAVEETGEGEGEAAADKLEAEAATAERLDRGGTWLAQYMERTSAVLRKPDRSSHEAYSGGRRVVRKTRCGWCMDGMHDGCKHETAWFERVWVCACECNAEWVAVDVGSGEIVEKKEESDDGDED